MAGSGAAARHGLAADVVSVKGETRAERWSSSERLWKWIDTHGKEFGIGRPYLDKEVPHVYHRGHVHDDVPEVSTTVAEAWGSA
jgi:hypothetical protein